jgi:hypothetical protein
MTSDRNCAPARRDEAVNAGATGETIAGGFSPSRSTATGAIGPVAKIDPNEFSKPIARIPRQTLRYVARDDEDLERMVREEEAAVRSHQAKKLAQLAAHLHCSTWPDFALALAVEVYPGLRIVDGVPKSQGRPPKWKGSQGAQLVAEVSAITEVQQKSTDDALRMILEFRGVKKREMPKRFKALKARYYEAIRSHLPAR